MHKQEIYADNSELTSAGILVTPRTETPSKFFFSHLSYGYDLRSETQSEVMQPDVREQVAIALRNIDAALKQAGGGPCNIVRLTVFVKDVLNIDAYASMLAVTETIQQFFGFGVPGNVTLPAQSVIFVSRLPYDHLGQLVGIEATALID